MWCEKTTTSSINAFLLDREDDRMYIVPRENRTIFRASLSGKEFVRQSSDYRIVSLLNLH